LCRPTWCCNNNNLVISVHVRNYFVAGPTKHKAQVIGCVPIAWRLEFPRSGKWSIDDLFDAAGEQLLCGTDGGGQWQSRLVVADDTDTDSDLVVAESVGALHVPTATLVHSTILAHQETVRDVVPSCTNGVEQITA